MAIHSHTRVSVHMIWSTHKRQNMIEEVMRKKLHGYLKEYCLKARVNYLCSYVNADHIHILFDLPPEKSVADVAKLLKGASSRWLNRREEQQIKFSWGRGYAAFSVSESNVKGVLDYIKNQKEHHANRSYKEELDLFLLKHKVEVVNR
ncbi:MAG: IS200/IS605 family transposase [Candidatus Marinimicrobia bacterium]|nr:IS200/IS605 family transposase [Candidatus Neomarinimicrobiota bacterium]MCF7904787.1 IS200/IS605 family transposase [Candidatus Neomarinimicrobiota bacterium]